jgi:hypothetical protein
MPPAHEAPDLVKYGDGLDVAQLALGNVRRALKAGTYVVDGVARAAVTDALTTMADPAAPDLPTDTLKDVLHDPDNKAFRNAVTSIAIEQAWPAYAERVMDGNIYTIGFNGQGRSSLRALRGHEELTAAQIARLVGASNQHVLTHYICELFQNGAVTISGDATKDQDYLAAYKEQTDLDIDATSNFRTIPLTAGSPSVFTTSGTVGIRTHAFGLANMLDYRAGVRGFRLSNDEHRGSLEYTLRTVTTPQYLPTTTVAIASSMPLADRKLRGLDTKKWTDTGNPGHFFIFPKPEIIRAANDRLHKEQRRLRDLDEPKTLPPETHCPAFHGRVPSSESTGRVVPVPLDLTSIVLRQLDMHFYPRRAA